MTLPDGQILEGQFVNDKFDGLGKSTLQDGCMYEGPWVDGMKHG